MHSSHEQCLNVSYSFVYLGTEYAFRFAQRNFMRTDKLILNANTKLEDVANYFKNLGPDKQVRARELGDGRIQLYVRKDSPKQFLPTS